MTELAMLPYMPQASQVALVVKNPPANAGDIQDTRSIPGLGRSPGGGHLHSSILAWRISWAEESGGLQSKGSQRVMTEATEHTRTHATLQIVNSCQCQFH